MNKLLGFIMLAVVCLYGCDSKKVGEGLKETMGDLQGANDLHEVKIKQYSIMLPEHMKPYNKLNPDASLQYANIYKELYIMVIDETKGSLDSAFKDNYVIEPFQDSTLFGTYTNVIIDGYSNRIGTIDSGSVKNITINGMHGKQVALTGQYDSISFYYNVAMLEGKKHFYQVFSWTLEKNREKYAPDMEKMVASFKEQ